MASPFPGMDPYLEHPTRWPGLHLRLITYLGDKINTLLPDRYVANLGERVYIVEPQRSMYPDIFLVKKELPPVRDRGGVLVCDPRILVQAEPQEVREPFIEILTAGESGQVVTAIEILSPTNKSFGTEGWDLYGLKQRQVLASPIHLLEFDFLREGRHRVGAPLSGMPEKSSWDYLVSLHRGGGKGEFEVWTIPLVKPLPRVLVPLANVDPDLIVDLQEVFTHCYDVGNYARRIDYRQPCQPPLEGDRAVWADALLKEKKLR